MARTRKKADQPLEEKEQTNTLPAAVEPEETVPDVSHSYEGYVDVAGESLSSFDSDMPDADCVKKVYFLENLDSESCAAMIERQIKEIPDVKYAAITYTTKQLRISAKDPDALLPQIQQICTSISSGIKVVPRTKSPGSMVTKTYILENFDCVNYGSRIEKQVNELRGVSSATLTSSTKELRITAKYPDSLVPDVQALCAVIAPDARVVPKDNSPRGKDVLDVHTILPEARDTEPLFRLTDNMRTLLGIAVGIVLFVIAEILRHNGRPQVSILLFVVAYIVLAGRVIVNAVRNVMHHRFFEENFLMTIATLCAFALRLFPEAVGIMIFYRIGEYVEHIAVERSRTQIMDSVDMRPKTVNLVIGDEIQVIPAENANVGDILLIRPGERVPLDGVIVEGESRLDTSPVTGEPVPTAVSYGDEIVSGCINTSGELKMRVDKVLEESMVTRILDSVETATASRPNFDRFVTRFTQIYTPIVVLLAICVAIFPSMVTGRWYYYAYTAVTFLVMSCPCAILLSVPLTYFCGIGAASKRGILFKNGAAVEAMKDIAAVVMDKTGTITKGNFAVQSAVPASNDLTSDELLSLCASCELSSTHPIGISVLRAANEKSLKIVQPTELEEVPGYGIRAVIRRKTVLCGNRKLMDKYNISLDDYQKSEYGTEVLVARDGVFIGYLIIADTIKEDAKPAISELKEKNISTVMLTGDAEDSAQAVADTTGIDEVHAKLLPQDKLTELIQVRNAHGDVMFVGDGINDATVLACADVGAAMGNGADAAIEAADVVYMNSNMEAIPESLDIAQSTNRISWENVIFALIVKVVIMVLGLCGFANLWVAIIADTAVSVLCVLNSIRLLFTRRR